MRGFGRRLKLMMEEVREAFEVVEPTVELSDSEMVYSFRIRNNRARFLMTDFVACFADETVRGHVDLEAYATSESKRSAISYRSTERSRRSQPSAFFLCIRPRSEGAST